MTSLNSSKDTKDQGWAWIIVLAGMMNVTLTVGVYRCTGILMVELMNVFNSQTSETASMFAYFGISYMFSALLLNLALGDVFHERVLAIMAALIGFLGFFVTYFLTNLSSVTMVLGLSLGVSCQTTLSSSISLTARYFRRYVTFATGMVVGGAGLGSFIWPVFMRYLLDEYTYKGTSLILSGIILNSLVCSALMRPAVGTLWPRIDPSEAYLNDCAQCTESKCTKEHTGKGQNNTEEGLLKDTGNTNSNKNSKKPFNGIESKKVTVKNKRTTECSTFAEMKDCMRRFLFMKQAERKEQIHIPDVFAFSLCKDPMFLIMQVFSFFNMTCIEYLVQYYPAVTSELGFKPYDSAIFLSIIGIMGFISRPLIGALGDCLPKRYPVVMIAVFILNANVFLSRYAVTFWSQVTYAFTVGLTFGVPLIFTVALIREFFCIEEEAKIIGATFVARGLGIVFGNPLFAWLRDITDLCPDAILIN